jgi:fatty acid desaturase
MDMSEGPAEEVGFSIAEAREIVKDLFRPNPRIYWMDFSASMVVGLAGFLLVPAFGLLTPWALLLWAVSILALYRGAVFIHELVHLRRGTFTSFRVAWYLLCGVLLLIPPFMYENHWDHHNRRHYGTDGDGEYIPFARRPPSAIITFLAASPIVPLLAVYRFLVLAPLAWLVPRVRQAVYTRASSLQIDFDYVRRVPSAEELRSWRLQELGCFLYLVAVLALLVSGTLPPYRIGQAYLTIVGIVGLNSLRLLAAHRYRSSEAEMTFVEQLMDSINYPRNAPLTALWAPVGLRMHALHHLFPGMPYHALAEAHRRLLAQLPADSPYRDTSSPGLWATLRQLFKEAQESQGGGGMGLQPPRMDTVATG